MAGLVGLETPRLLTPPLRLLTPDTSRGFEVVEFAERDLRVDLIPWQRRALIHGLELLPDGRLRFEIVLVLVARQNGKTTLAKVLALWRMKRARSLVLGTSTNLEYARESWQSAVELAEDALADEVAGVKYGALDTSLTLTNRSRYKVAAATRKGGRSLSVDLGIADELREHRPEGERDGWEAWAALSGATTARMDAQIWALSNAGDRSSVVLNHFRDSAIGYIETGEGDDSLCLIEHSAPDGSDIHDREAWAYANPALGVTITERTLRSKASNLPPNVFRVEHMCEGVGALDGAVDMAAWRDTKDAEGTMDGLRGRIAAVVDVAPDGGHVSLLVAAPAGDGRVRIEAVAAWDDTNAARDELAGKLDRVGPVKTGWFPSGPAAALKPVMKAVGAEEITGGDVNAACMGFADLVKNRRIIHPDDELINAHVTGASKLYVGDGWRFVRRGAGHVDAAYAAAGAVLLAQTLPKPLPKSMVV